MQNVPTTTRNYKHADGGTVVTTYHVTDWLKVLKHTPMKKGAWREHFTAKVFGKNVVKDGNVVVRRSYAAAETAGYNFRINGKA